MIREEVAHNRDFMQDGYLQIAEPLNLCADGQRWLHATYERHRTREDVGLVLGATPWIRSLLRATQRAVVSCDISRPMLDLTAADGTRRRGSYTVQGDWRALPIRPGAIGTAVGDNSFTYLEFPSGWRHLGGELASAMCPGAMLFARVWSVPPDHQPATVSEIVSRFETAVAINYTEVRTALLFSRLDTRTYAIDTESVLGLYERHAETFTTLLARAEGRANDLVTIRKYRNSGAVYYAPPLENILDVLQQWFRIASVEYGPYAMTEYFPLIVASRK